MTPRLAALSLADLAQLGTVGTALVALFAAIFAALQVRELRRTREDQVRPYVIVDIQPGATWDNLFDLVIENIGSTPAHGVTFEFEPPLEQSDDSGYPISESVLLREGVLMLPPGRKIRAFFDASHKRIDTDLPMRYSVTVRLKNSNGKRQPAQRYTIDLNYMYGLTQIREYGSHDAAKALIEIQKSVKKWSDIHGRLRVWVRDEDARIRDDRVERELTGHAPSLASKAPSDLLLTLGRNVLVRTAIRRFRGRRNCRSG